MPKKTNQPSKNLQIPKFIIIIAKVFAFFSSKLATRFAAKLFVTPIKHKTPKREKEMETNSIKKILPIPSIHKQIMTYQYGDFNKRILLVHGWSGRGTQLFKIADELLANGFTSISFDAPAHGKSPGNSTIMIDFIESILEIDKQYGPFDAIVGHSLGGMSTLNAIKRGLQVKKAVIIGSGDVVQDIIIDFISKLQLDLKIAFKLRDYFEQKYGETMDDYSAYKAAATVSIPLLILHDNNDAEVPVSASIHIHEHCKNSQLIITNDLGHRKILGDKNVVETTANFCISK
ncbi:MAG: alpha/beta fold hydrolase [Flavobacterium sp.]